MPAISLPLTRSVHELKCDRCREPFTAERYAVSEPQWHVFFKPGERVICIQCLRDDPFYKATRAYSAERGSGFAEDMIVLALALFIGGVILALARQWGAWP